MFGSAELPTTHSYGAKNYQLRVVKQNLLFNLIGIRDRAHYDGSTILPFWTGSQQVHVLHP